MGLIPLTTIRDLRQVASATRPVCHAPLPVYPSELRTTTRRETGRENPLPSNATGEKRMLGLRENPLSCHGAKSLQIRRSGRQTKALTSKCFYGGGVRHESVAPHPFSEKLIHSGGPNIVEGHAMEGGWP